MKSFAYAIRGLLSVIGGERHMRIHLCFAFYVVLGGLVVGLTPAEWGVVLACCGLVMGLECLNTAIERLCDGITGKYSETIKFAKDAAAGAVLVSALFSAAAGCVIFFRDGRPEKALEVFMAKPISSAMLALGLALGTVLFILTTFRRNKNDYKNSGCNDMRKTECGQIDPDEHTCG